MTRKPIVVATQLGVVAALLILLEFVDRICRTSPGFGFMLMREVEAVFSDAATQWIVVLFLAFYLVFFRLLERQVISDRDALQSGHSIPWMIIAVAWMLAGALCVEV